MLRRSKTLRIVPQCHAMIPQHVKIRGHLYRPSRLNYYCRLASTTRHQRSTKEEILFLVSLNSDVAISYFIFWVFVCFALVYSYCVGTYSIGTHKNRQFSGALNNSERLQRNADMQRIFDNHTARVKRFSDEHGVPFHDDNRPGNYFTPF